MSQKIKINWSTFKIPFFIISTAIVLNLLFRYATGQERTSETFRTPFQALLLLLYKQCNLNKTAKSY